MTVINLTNAHPRESSVRSYCRSIPTVFKKAKGTELFDATGKRYLDFLSGAGTLNYGHNHPELKKALVEYMSEDGVVHGLDMATEAKNAFIQSFMDIVLKPRGLDYKIQFPGPTGTNAVEAALKLAQKVTGRKRFISFTNGFHGMTLGALSVTGNHFYKDSIDANAGYEVSFMPYCNYMGDEMNTLAYLRRHLEDGSSGVDLPAAIIVESVQGEGGVNVASARWLRELSLIAQEFGALLIIDDIQAGCGRSGDFFSFEEAGITPDIVTLSKSISGFGLPMALVLMKSDLDVWEPGEHNGTFRGNNLAFVTARKTLEMFWKSPSFIKSVRAKGKMIEAALLGIAAAHPSHELSVRGRGMMWGIEGNPDVVAAMQKFCFTHGLVIETSGSNGQVLKLLPPLTISEEELREGLGIIADAADNVFKKSKTNLKKTGS